MKLPAFHEIPEGQVSDFFVVLAEKTLSETKAGKPFYRVTFKDSQRSAQAMIWDNSSFFTACSDVWSVGTFYKIRGSFKMSQYGPQLDISQIRETQDVDRQTGFSEDMFMTRSRFDSEEMFSELIELLKNTIGNEDPLFDLCNTILMENRQELLVLSAASKNHHAFVGGWLEHTLNVTHNALMLANRYSQRYPDLTPSLDVGLVAAGAALHDIGKLRELGMMGTAFDYTVEGNLIGHMLIGRDIVRDACREFGLEGERYMLLEHIVISHQDKPEWGSPKRTMIPEALLVHYADDVDAKYAIMNNLRNAVPEAGMFSSSKNSMDTKVYRAEGWEY